MKKSAIKYIMFLCIISMISNIHAENRKIAQTGMKFLSISTDARHSALSSAVTSLDDGSSTSLFYNPASMGFASWTTDFSLGRTQWIADIDYLFGSIAVSPNHGQYGILALSFIYADYGNFLGTIRADNEQGFLDIGTFSPMAYSVGLGYAKALSSKFSVGGQAKYADLDLVGGLVDFENDQQNKSKSYQESVWAFDFGVLYKTGYKSLNLGMSIRNFSQEIQFSQESFQLPLTFEMGISMNILDIFTVNSKRHYMLVSMDAVHPRDDKEQIDVGVEYKFNNMVALRAGYTTPKDEQGISLGAGLQQSFADLKFNLNYAFTSFGVFTEIHRFTVNFEF